MKKIMLDIGHGGTDPGAQANGLIEKNLNLKVGLKVKGYLSGIDAEVRLSRETDISLDADARVALIQKFNPTLCVSIHHNAANSTARGSEVIHAAVSTKDDILAADIMNRLEKAGMPKRRAFTKLNDQGQDWYFMIRRIADADTDSIIVEGGFVDNAEDAKLLKDEKYLDAEAKAIADAVVNYLGLNQKLTPIMGEGIATVEQMVSYALKINPKPKLPSCSIEELANIFYQEGLTEGVRWDIAWAQSIKETGAFNYGGIVLPEQNNYAGIGALNNNSQGQAATFDSPRIGVRAQVQHLKAYASKEAVRHVIVDPRFELVKRGSAPNVEWLGVSDNPSGAGWASPGKGYGADIIARLQLILSEPKTVPADSKVPQWQQDAFKKLVDKKIINTPEAWASRLGDQITVGEVMGIIANLTV